MTLSEYREIHRRHRLHSSSLSRLFLSCLALPCLVLSCLTRSARCNIIAKTLWIGDVKLLLLPDWKPVGFLFECSVWTKTEGRQAGLKNKQISATRTPKMEPESSKSFQRTNKKGPMSKQWRHLGNRRHLRKQKRPQRGPREKPNGAPEADWRRKASQHGSNRDPKRCQKKSK